MEWRVLVVDDDLEQAEGTADVISGNKALGPDHFVKCTIAKSFSEALENIQNFRYDLLVLDLQDDEVDLAPEGLVDDMYSGERILTKLRECHFTPVVFYSGFAQKVEHLATTFVKVVRKGSPAIELRTAISDICTTHLPQLIRHIQEEQRKYLWEHVEGALKSDDISDVDELSFLLARRLARSLDGKVIRKYLDCNYAPDHEIAHPIELYIWPPMGESIGFGDILLSSQSGINTYYFVLNPACDFEQCKAEKILLAKCTYLEETIEYLNIVRSKKESPDEPVSRAQQRALQDLICDNRSGKKVQAERYKFLPKTSFVPNLIIDYQNLVQVPLVGVRAVNGFKRVATLDTPFAESVQSRFVRYYGRIGTPDLESENLLKRIVDKI